MNLSGLRNDQHGAVQFQIVLTGKNTGNIRDDLSGTRQVMLVLRFSIRVVDLKVARDAIAQSDGLQRGGAGALRLERNYAVDARRERLIGRIEIVLRLVAVRDFEQFARPLDSKHAAVVRPELGILPSQCGGEERHSGEALGSHRRKHVDDMTRLGDNHDARENGNHAAPLQTPAGVRHQEVVVTAHGATDDSRLHLSERMPKSERCLQHRAVFAIDELHRNRRAEPSCLAAVDEDDPFDAACRVGQNVVLHASRNAHALPIDALAVALVVEKDRTRVGQQIGECHIIGIAAVVGNGDQRQNAMRPRSRLRKAVDMGDANRVRHLIFVEPFRVVRDIEPRAEEQTHSRRRDESLVRAMRKLEGRAIHISEH